MGQKIAGLLVFNEESNGGWENAVIRTVPEIQAKGILNFFTIMVAKSLEEQIIYVKKTKTFWGI